MLLQGRSILFLFVLLLAVSCNSKKHTDFVRETQLYKAYSQKVATKSTYKKVFNAANDSIKRWCEKELGNYEYIRINQWRIDSLVCFSSDASKCIMALCKQSTFYKDQDADGITFLYGVNIKDKWYFFSGPFIVIPREMYISEDKINEPLSFAKLHEIAMEEVFGGYLVKNAKGKLEINEAFFSDIERILAIHKKEFNTEKEWEDWFVKSMMEARWSQKN